MKKLLVLCLLLTAPLRADRPNIVFVLADDLGYGDLGSFGQKKIRTPHLDRLAAEGMKLTQHYAGNNVCAPSRCVLLTGLHPGHTFIRDNREAPPQGALQRPEGQLALPSGTQTLPKLLQKAGYVTGAFGKWGLGGPGAEGEPLRQGFNRFFGYNCQRVAHNFYPEFLWDDARPFLLKNTAFAAHQKLPADADPKNPDSYKSFRGTDYAPDVIMTQARRFVAENKDKPFFLFVPTTVPHLALQVPDDSLAEYNDAFAETPYPGGRGYLPNLTPRATYAAMITRLDKEIGALMAQVTTLGLDEKTIFVFTSDNGPLYDELGGTDAEFFNSHGGLRGRKGSFFEGGFRVPVIVRWPGKIKPGTESQRVTGFEDWLPTLLQIIGEKAPEKLDGISFAPTLLGKTQPDRNFLYRESPGYGGQQYVRVGDWVGLRQKLMRPGAKAEQALQIFDLTTDPAQEKNVVKERPEVAARLLQIMKEQHTPSKEFPIKGLDEDG